MKKYCTEIILAIILLALSLISIFVGVIDIDIKDLLTNDNNALMIFVVSRLPRLLAIICTGMGMSVAGLIMQQLCMNKFVSPTTGATISSAQLGILLALLFIPNSTLWQRAGFAFVTAILGTWVFVWFIQKVQYKDVVMVPLVGIMFGNSSNNRACNEPRRLTAYNSPFSISSPVSDESNDKLQISYNILSNSFSIRGSIWNNNINIYLNSSRFDNRNDIYSHFHN